MSVYPRPVRDVTRRRRHADAIGNAGNDLEVQALLCRKSASSPPAGDDEWNPPLQACNELPSRAFSLAGSRSNPAPSLRRRRRRRSFAPGRHGSGPARNEAFVRHDISAPMHSRPVRESLDLRDRRRWNTGAVSRRRALLPRGARCTWRECSPASASSFSARECPEPPRHRAPGRVRADGLRASSEITMVQAPPGMIHRL